MIGVGNRWRGDDGAGPAVAEALGGVATEDASRLLDLWAGAEHAVVVDAAVSGAAPGTVHRFDAAAGALPAALMRSSTHAFSVAEAVELARALRRLPARVDVYAVEGEDFRAGATLSVAVARAVGQLIRELTRLSVPRRR